MSGAEDPSSKSQTTDIDSNDEEQDRESGDVLSSETILFYFTSGLS